MCENVCVCVCVCVCVFCVIGGAVPTRGNHKGSEHEGHKGSEHERMERTRVRRKARKHARHKGTWREQIRSYHAAGCDRADHKVKLNRNKVLIFFIA